MEPKIRMRTKLEDKIKMLSHERYNLSREIRELTSIVGTREEYEKVLVSGILSHESTNKYLKWTEKDKHQITTFLNYYEIKSKQGYDEAMKFLKKLPEGSLDGMFRYSLQDKIIANLEEVFGNDKDKLLLAAEYLANSNLIYGSCGGGHLGRFKKPTTCEGCHRAERTLKRLSIDNLVRPLGSRQYEIPEFELDEAFKRIVGQDPKIKEIIKTVEAKKESKELLELQIDRLRTKLKVYDLIEREGYNPDIVEDVMPEAIDYIKNTKGTINNIVFDFKTKTIAILSDEWYYPGGGVGTQYSKVLRVFRGENEFSRKYVYRDAYSESNDAPYFNFDGIEELVVEGDNIKVGLRKGVFLTETEFKLGYKKIEREKLSDEAQIKFLKEYEDIKRQLLVIHTRENGFMQNYIPLDSRATTEGIMPYDGAIIESEKINVDYGTAEVVIKAQIDANAGYGKQFEFVKYKIEFGKGFTIEERDVKSELAMRDGYSPNVRL